MMVVCIHMECASVKIFISAKSFGVPSIFLKVFFLKLKAIVSL